MGNRCKNCKFFDNYNEPDNGSYTEHYYCSLGYESLDPEKEACDFYIKEKFYKYKEKDTICDTCEYFDECTYNRMEVTGIEDVKRHYVPAFGVRCKKMRELQVP